MSRRPATDAPLPLPRNLVDAVERYGSPERRAWLARLPATVATLSDRWSLWVDQPFEPGGQTAWVAPAHNDEWGDVVLKVAWAHTEAAHEADGLRTWDGDGAVRLHAAVGEGDTAGLVLERCRPGTTLGGRPEAEQDAVITGLLGRLWLTPLPSHPFRPLAQMCDEWADEFEVTQAVRRPVLDPGVVRAGIALLRELPRSPPRQTLLCTDLHAENVLAAEREPWLVIDPKPYVGDPTFDPVQHMLNCPDRLHADPIGLVASIADRLDLDRHRLRLWLFARCVQESFEWPGLDELSGRIAP